MLKHIRRTRVRRRPDRDRRFARVQAATRRPRRPQREICPECGHAVDRRGYCQCEIA